MNNVYAKKAAIIIIDPARETFEDTGSVFGTGRNANKSRAVKILTFHETLVGGSVVMISLFLSSILSDVSFDI